MSQLLQYDLPSGSAGRSRVTSHGSGIVMSQHEFLKDFRNLLYAQYIFWGKNSTGFSDLWEELARLRNNFSHNFGTINYPHNIGESSLKLQNDFIINLPANIQPIFRELKLSNIEASQYLDTVKKFRQYLKKQHIKYSLDENYTSDVEYPDWIQLVITIRIKSNFNKVYSKVKSKIYKILDSTASDNLYQKLIIKIQSH